MGRLLPRSKFVYTTVYTQRTRRQREAYIYNRLTHIYRHKAEHDIYTASDAKTKQSMLSELRRLVFDRLNGG